MLATRVVVLMHKREKFRTSNTGKLAPLALTNAELIVRGFEGGEIQESQIVPVGYKSILLYPADDAVDLSPSFLASLGGPVNIIVPDGNWRQASKVMNRVACLKKIPRVKIPRGAPTQYGLRRENKLGGLATFEAIARAVGVIEGDEVQRKMERFFHIMVERLLWGRGKRLAAECLEEIPKAALN